MEITNLKLKRKEKDFKQIEFAQKLKLKTRTYQRYETGERSPDVLTGCLIGKKLGLEKITELEELFKLGRESSSSQK